MEKNNPKLINAWSSYDWANSVYNLIITTAIFPIYYTSTTNTAFGGDIVEFFGLSIENTVLLSYAISFSFFVIVISSPLLSGIADYIGNKRLFMQLFTYLGSFSCIGLYFFTGPNVEYGIICSVLASVGYAGSLVFYNGFLPEVATPDRMDSVSARGFSFGYVGSVLLLIVILATTIMPETFGFADAGAASRFGFLLVGFWWMGFAQIAFYYLRDKPTGNKMSSEVWGRGIQELKGVFAAVRARSTMKRFLASFFLYSMGVLTVMLLAPVFAKKEVNMGTEEIIIIVLILQLLAIAGAYFFAWIAQKRGSKLAISLILILWMSVCLICYNLYAKVGFYAIAAILGLGMGGVQSISRSTYSKLIPSDTKDTASYFSFFDITEKLAIVIGTFSYGLIEQLTGSMRNSMVFMTVFFLSGLIMLQFTDLTEVERKKEVLEE